MEQSVDRGQAELGIAEVNDSAALRRGGLERVHLHMPVDVRSASLAIIAVLACVVALQWAKDVVIPILMGVLLSYALTPVVNQLVRWRLPRGVAAFAIITTLVAVMAGGTWALSGQANALLELAPQVAQKFRQFAAQMSGSASALQRVEQAATELQQVTGTQPVASSASATSASLASPAVSPAKQSRSPVQSQPIPAVAHVVVEKPPLVVRDVVIAGTLGAVTFLGQIAVIFLIALFLLASGNTFRRKLVKMAGPKLSQRKITVEALEEIAAQIERYLLVQLAISSLVGIATWLVFWSFGMNQAAVWGVIAAVTNLIPYLGAVVVGGGAAAIGMLQFDSVQTGLLIGASSFAIHTVVGNLVTPWLMGRAARMSAVAVFVSVLSFGWLWGVWGLLLGVPILLVTKTVCDRVDELKPIGELLGA